jgi:hypothetical protein
MIPDLGDDACDGEGMIPDLGDDACGGDDLIPDLGDDARGGDDALPAGSEGEGYLSLLAPQTSFPHSEFQAEKTHLEGTVS